MMDRTRRVILLIDYDNLQICASRDTPGRDLQLEPVVQLAQHYGTVMVARAYAEWNLSTERLAVYKAGIEPAYAPVLRTDSDRAGKSLADTVMVAEAMDMLWTLSPEVLVLATSDKDLIPLARVAKQRGSKVVVLGSDYTAVPLREMADEHITYKQLITDGPPRAIENAAGTARNGGESSFRRGRDRGDRERDRDREQRDREQREQQREGRELRGDRERGEGRSTVHRVSAAASSTSASTPTIPALPAASPAAAVPPAADADSDAGGRRRRRRGSRRRTDRLDADANGLIDDVLDEGSETDAEVFEVSSGTLEDETPAVIESIAEVLEEADLDAEDEVIAEVQAEPAAEHESVLSDVAPEEPMVNGTATSADVEANTPPATSDQDGEAPAEGEAEAPKPRTRARRVASASRGRTRRVG